MKNIYFQLFLLLISNITIVSCAIEKPSVDKSNLANTNPIFAMHLTFNDTCKKCHESKLPNVPNANGYIHSGSRDCKSCHSPPTWLPALNPHNPTPVSCNQCHSSDRPKLIASGNLHYTLGDCNFCHSISANWKPAKNPHSPVPVSCNSCHITTSRSSRYHEGTNFHSGSIDCAGCHSPNLTPTWAAKTNYCSLCHN